MRESKLIHEIVFQSPEFNYIVRLTDTLLEITKIKNATGEDYNYALPVNDASRLLVEIMCKMNR